MDTWKQIPGFDDFEVSNFGQIRKIWHHTPVSTFTAKKTGYVYARLPGKIRPVHRLVLLAFKGPCPSGCESRHANDIRSDNRLDNLSWGTRHQNFDDMRAGRLASPSTKVRKLSPADVYLIKIMLASGIPQNLIAESFQVNKTTICHIANGKRWDYIG